MKYMIMWFAAMLLFVQSAPAAENSLWDNLVEVTIQHIKQHGPDSEVGEFISTARHHAWSRRKEFVDLVAPYLKSDNPGKVAGAIEVLSRFRGYCPMSYLGDFEKRHHDFFAEIDTIVSRSLLIPHINDEDFHLTQSPADISMEPYTGSSHNSSDSRIGYKNTAAVDPDEAQERRNRELAWRPFVFGACITAGAIVGMFLLQWWRKKRNHA